MQLAAAVRRQRCDASRRTRDAWESGNAASISSSTSTSISSWQSASLQSSRRRRKSQARKRSRATRPLASVDPIPRNGDSKKGAQEIYPMVCKEPTLDLTMPGNGDIGAVLVCKEPTLDLTMPGTYAMVLLLTLEPERALTMPGNGEFICRKACSICGATSCDQAWGCSLLCTPECTCGSSQGKPFG